MTEPTSTSDGSVKADTIRVAQGPKLDKVGRSQKRQNSKSSTSQRPLAKKPKTTVTDGLDALPTTDRPRYSTVADSQEASREIEPPLTFTHQYATPALSDGPFPALDNSRDTTGSIGHPESPCDSTSARPGNVLSFSCIMQILDNKYSHLLEKQVHASAESHKARLALDQRQFDVDRAQEDLEKAQRHYEVLKKALGEQHRHVNKLSSDEEYAKSHLVPYHTILSLEPGRAVEAILSSPAIWATALPPTAPLLATNTEDFQQGSFDNIIPGQSWDEYVQGVDQQ